MSPALFALGRSCYRRPGRVAAAWLIVAVLLAALAGLVGKGTSEQYTVPGSESQAALDDLHALFPEMAGASGQIVLVAPPGQRLETPAVTEAVAASAVRLEAMPHVDAVTDPFAPGEGVPAAISDDGRAAIVTITLDVSAMDVPAEARDGIRAEGARLAGELPDITVEAGGDVLSASAPGVTLYELVGLALAAIVLLVFFRSVRGAASPVIAALASAAITGLIIMVATAAATLTATAPMLALMIGIAVGIDYSLFLLSRFNEFVLDGVSGEEAAPRATATAGSAVVFAGLTIITALAGLVIVGLPFLSAMGLAGALGVAVSVVGAITITPALMRWLDPIAQRRAAARGQGAESEVDDGGDTDGPRDGAHDTASAVGEEWEERAPVAANGWAGRWVAVVTRWPLVTLVLVTGVLLVTAIPAKDLQYALPSNGTAPAANSERRAYDLVAEHFGPGENGPLLIVSDIVTSTDPLGYMNELEAKVEAVEGVDRVILATPNRNADTGVVIAIPTTAPDDPATSDLVERLRQQADDFGGADGHDVRVTGLTAVQIDVSNRLADALLPFGLVVVGLSLVLLLVVFRSFIVPLTAALGFVLSVLASFGAVAAVFEWGWFADALNVTRVGPVISLLPIILMGVLFGLAMDYQMFIVSRMHEHYAHNGDPKAAVREGFTASAPVVAAAAIIMVGVFAAFVPGGDMTIKAIAFGLSVGVFVDAFIVRMILVPAALHLFGHAAWALPAGLGRSVPHLDVEGHGVVHQITAEATIAAHPDRVVHARSIAVTGPRGPVFDGLDLDLRRGELGLLSAPEGAGKTSAMLALAGRLPTTAGELDVAGAVLPEQAALVQRRAALAEFGVVNGLENHLALDSHIAERLAPRSLRPWAPRRRIDEVMARFAQACAIAGASAGEAAEPLDPRTMVGDLSRLERAVFGIVLAELGRPLLLCVDDIDTLPTYDERVGLLRLLGSIARGEAGGVQHVDERGTVSGPAVIAAANNDLEAHRVAEWVGLPLERVRIITLASSDRLVPAGLAPAGLAPAGLAPARLAPARSEG